MRTYRVGKLELDEPRLRKELECITSFKYSEAYSDYLCGGPWKSCMLWSVGGEPGDGLVTNYDYSKPPGVTKYAGQLPYLMEVVGRSFDMERLNFARLAVISDSVIIPHKDLLELTDVPERARNVHRLHVPLVTNDDCFFSQDNTVYRMKFGEAWFFDSGQMHSAASFSGQDRVHLMLDFPEVDDPRRLVKFAAAEEEAIPRDSVQPRGGISEAERDALMSLASVIDMDNYKDVFSIVIKKHYRKDGGPDFIWEAVRDIAGRGKDPAVAARVDEMYRYFMVERPASGAGRAPEAAEGDAVTGRGN